jgi:hypothetical protein
VRPVAVGQGNKTETIMLQRDNSVELNARNSEILGSAYAISTPRTFKPMSAMPTSFVVMSIKATPM